MDVDETKSVIALVEGDIVGLLMDLIADTEIGLVFKDERRGRCCSGSG